MYFPNILKIKIKQTTIKIKLSHLIYKIKLYNYKV